ncbi:MAG: DUF1015 domain-containing protein [Chloroflexi bacterium]|nr:DUF1015 domain-containing protein [Chloroflexota bacterium]
MAVVRPFRGIRYSPAVVGRLSQVLCPPYDIITGEQREELYRRSPYNMVRLEYGKPLPLDGEREDVYTRAANLYRQWRQDGVLLQEERPAIYLLEEEYLQAGVRRTRRGVLAAVRLEEYDKGIILPHEETSPGPKKDRLRLMQSCHANFSPLMALYRDPGGLQELLSRETQRPPDLVAQGWDAVACRLWVVKDAQTLQEVGRALSPLRLYLADGHHRYETALQFRDEAQAAKADAPADAALRYVLACLIELHDPGLQLLSFHRLLHPLPPERLIALRQRAAALFEAEAYPLPALSTAALEAFLRVLDREGAGRPALGWLECEGPRLTLLRLKPGLAPHQLPPAPAPELSRCETWLLHAGVLNPVLGPDPREVQQQVSFLHDLGEVVAGLQRNESPGAFLLRPIPAEDFQQLVQAGQRLPPKTTYFYPKLPTGLIINPLEGVL